MSYPDLPDEFTFDALEVAPGVSIKVLAWGDHWVPSLGGTVHGALVAVRDRSDMRGKVVHHIDGNAYNNDPSNLVIADPKENDR
jgi:hypothetical protein